MYQFLQWNDRCDLPLSVIYIARRIEFGRWMDENISFSSMLFIFCVKIGHPSYPIIIMYIKQNSK